MVCALGGGGGGLARGHGESGISSYMSQNTSAAGSGDAGMGDWLVGNESGISHSVPTLSYFGEGPGGYLRRCSR